MSPGSVMARGSVFIVRNDSRGLHRDAAIIEGLLVRTSTRHVIYPNVHPQAVNMQFALADRVSAPPPCPEDVVIVLESLVTCRELLAARRLVWVPNAEFMSPADIALANALRAEVWHKTRLSREVFAAHSWSMDQCTHRDLGFTSEDVYDPSVPKRYDVCLHVAGSSWLKGTAELLEVWRNHPNFPHLIVVSQRPWPVHAPNVSFVQDPSDADLRGLMNACGVHLCPSNAEGWGHSIVEGMSCGAVVVATDAEPMRDHIEDGVTGVLVPADSVPFAEHVAREFGAERGNNVARWHRVRPGALAAAVASLCSVDLNAMGARARAAFLAHRAAFLSANASLLDD